MEITDNILSLVYNTPNTIVQEVAQRVKERRLEAAYTQQELAKRAGIPLPTYRRFERTGEISFRSLVMLGMVFDMTDEFETLFSRKMYKSIDDILNADSKKRKRGKSNG
jgi:transcriptional regulator with XRE-family HTH domain